MKFAFAFRNTISSQPISKNKKRNNKYHLRILSHLITSLSKRIQPKYKTHHTQSSEEPSHPMTSSITPRSIRVRDCRTRVCKTSTILKAPSKNNHPKKKKEEQPYWEVRLIIRIVTKTNSNDT